MDVRNCRSCGKLFNYMGGIPLCPGCIRELDKKFEQVKEYIYDNPRADIQTISEENDVSTATIKRWVREEKLSFTDDSPIGLECEGCGVTIKTGRFCKSCKDKMANKLDNAYGKPASMPKPKKNQSEKAKMRYLDS